MNRQLNRRVLATGMAATLLAAVVILQVGCKSEPAAPNECPDPNAPATVQVDNLGTVGVNVFRDKNASQQERCVACVMSRQKFASCQTVYANSEGENRESIRARAKEKACADAGYKKGECPESAVISTRCKDEPRPANAMDPGHAVQKLFGAGKKLNIFTATPGDKGQDGAGAQPPTPSPGNAASNTGAAGKAESGDTGPATPQQDSKPVR